MNVKVVILNWNGREHLAHFLPSVVRCSPEGSVVVADNGSTDDSLEFLQNYFPQVEVLCLDRNYGYAGGYNRALAQIEADAYVLLNSDVEVVDGWLIPMLERLEDDPRVAILSPRILSYDRPSHFEYAGAAGGFMDCFGYPFCRGRILDTLEEDHGQYNQACEVFWASGACMLIRSSVFKDLGGFDADFFAHMEEIDLCWRAQLRGHKVMVEPAARVFHLGGGTLPNNSPRKLYLNYRNNLAMLYKNLSASSLFGVLFSRMVLDGLSALVFLAQGRMDFFRVVWQAHLDFHKWRADLKPKRAQIQRLRVSAHSRNIYRGSILLRYMLGRHTFDGLMSSGRR